MTHTHPRTVTIERAVTTAVQPSQRVLETAAMFGLGVDHEHRLRIIPPTDVPLPGGGIVFITGPSGGGKTTVLREIASQCRTHNFTTIILHNDSELPDRPLVDVFDATLEHATRLLARAGLGDAFVMLRRPCELSDGQRARLRIAQALHAAQQADSACIILADEFGATLDRLTASIVARQLRAWISHTAHTFVAATTHDDLLEPLEPDVLVVKGLGESIEVHCR